MSPKFQRFLLAGCALVAALNAPAAAAVLLQGLRGPVAAPQAPAERAGGSAHARQRRAGSAGESLHARAPRRAALQGGSER